MPRASRVPPLQHCRVDLRHVYLWKIPNEKMKKYNRVGKGATTSLVLHIPEAQADEHVTAPVKIQHHCSTWTREFFVGKFEITEEMRAKLEDGRYLEELC